MKIMFLKTSFYLLVGSLGVFTSARTNMFTVRYKNYKYRAVSIICVSKYEFYIVTFYIPFLRSFMFSNISALLFSLVLLVLSSCHLVDIIWYQEADNYAMSGFYILKGPFKYYAFKVHREQFIIKLFTKRKA